MIYFDNAATTFPKPGGVLRELNKCVKEYCGNSGRSSHTLSIKTSEKIYEARESIARLLDIESPERVVFTQNATHALNLAIKTTIMPGTHVLISDMEHNSVLRPIYYMAEKYGIEYSVFDSSGDIEKNICSLLKRNTKYMVSTLASNVTGREINLEKLAGIANKYSLTLIADASQIIGHKKISLSCSPCAVLCAPGHKALMGIQGCGFAVFTDDLQRESFIQGGSGSESHNPEMPKLLPEKFEAGTLNAPAIVSLNSGIKYIESVGMDEIERKLLLLTELCAERLCSIKNIVMYDYGSSVISFNISGVPCETLAQELAKYKICVRAGLHCAPLAHKKIGTEKIGTVRVSFSYLNSIKEIDSFYKTIASISKKY
jgi:cysteine desulfurase family protein